MQALKTPLAIGNHVVILLFASLGAVELIGREPIDAALWLSLAAAVAAFGRESNHWRQIAPWRKGLGIALLLLAVGLFIARIITDVAR